MMPAGLLPSSLMLAVVLCGLASVGCSESQSIRISHAPTYSYLQDPDAMAEVALWPSVPGSPGSPGSTGSTASPDLLAARDAPE